MAIDKGESVTQQKKGCVNAGPWVSPREGRVQEAYHWQVGFCGSAPPREVHEW